MQKNLLIATSTRADYGLLKPLISEALQNTLLNTKVLVTGTHLEEAYGYTINEIESDGINCIEKVALDLLEDEQLSNTIARSIIKFTEALSRLRPDILLILGDRYEIFALTIAAYTMKIPIAHIHGGETTLGALDEGFRHSITKMSSLHFPVTEIYKEKIINMGEDPDTVFNFGAPAIDSLNNVPKRSLTDLQQELGIELEDQKFAICTYHPETISRVSIDSQMTNLLGAIEKASDIKMIFTMPNSDPGNQIIRERITNYVKGNENHSIVVESLGFQRYVSLLSKSVFMIGNSSSGLTEAPMLGIPTVNIGDRQKGRFHPETVISCSHNLDDIIHAIKKCDTLNTIKKLPFGNGGSSKKIIAKIGESDLRKVLKKGLYEENTFK